MNKLAFNLIGIFLFVAVISPVVYPQKLATQVAQKQNDGGRLVEEFSFLLKDFKIDHQGETNNLNISISYRYIVNITKAEYPDFRWLARDVETLLTNYPNKDDYWEIVNKRVTSLLLQKYPALTSVTCEIKVDPSRVVPYARSSRVTRERLTTRTNRKRT
jgi:hypothetical protein